MSTHHKATAVGANARQIDPDAAVDPRVARGRRACWHRRVGDARRGFAYVDCHGRRVRDRAELARIRALAVPPGWTCVRVAPSARSALQAVGVDAAGRVQYRYHPAFAAKQQRKKYDKIVRFGDALPALRRAAADAVARDALGLGRARVLGVVVRLINDLYFRVGSEKSVRQNRTYGVTTLRNRHVVFGARGRLEFRYVGKHQVKQQRVVVDTDLARLIREIKTIGGAKLFEYLDEQGAVRAVTPRDVNAHIKEVAGREFSAKDFRTWGGTLQAARSLAAMGPARTQREAKRNVARALAQVAERLGNTPAVCRACYVHPAVVERYLEGRTLADFRARRLRVVRNHQGPAAAAAEYHPDELALLALLRAAPARAAGLPAAAPPVRRRRVAA